MSVIIRTVVALIAVWATVEIGSRIGLGLHWMDWPRALLFVVALAVVNAVIGPIARLFAMPLRCLTFGLIVFVVNALLFWATAHLTKGVEVEGFWAALFGSVVYGLICGTVNGLVNRKPDKD